MNSGDWLNIILILAGIFTMWMTLVSLAKRKFTDGFCMLWGVISACMVLAGFLLRPAGISNYISNTGLVLVVISGAGVLLLTWSVSREISGLIRKNHELAMQVSLLNQEHDKIRMLLEEMTGKDHNELWR